MLRNWADKFNKTLKKHTSSRRVELRVPIKISVEPDKKTGNLARPCELSTEGETIDFSASGLGFEVSSIRLQEFYLVGEGRRLRAEVSLPSGKVSMVLIGNRYKQTGEHISVARYFIGAKIVEMSRRDRNRYEEFLSGKKEKGGAFQLGIEKG